MKHLLDESGATSIEYAIVGSLIAAVVAATVQIIGGNLVAIFTNATSWFGS